jgi:hypothetical protein
VKRVYDAVVSVGEYTDKQTGKKKQQYRTVGAVLRDDDGRLSLKLELIPVTGFNGWINFYEPRDKEQRTQKPATEGAPFNDDIPW